MLMWLWASLIYHMCDARPTDGNEKLCEVVIMENDAPYYEMWWPHSFRVWDHSKCLCPYYNIKWKCLWFFALQDQSERQSHTGWHINFKLRPSHDAYHPRLSLPNPPNTFALILPQRRQPQNSTSLRLSQVPTDGAWVTPIVLCPPRYHWPIWFDRGKSRFIRVDFYDVF